MTLLKIDKFELFVKDCLYDGIFIGCDLKIDPNILFNDFLPFLHEYNERFDESSSLVINIDGDTFEGYLGNYIFDKDGNMRIWLIKEYVESSKNMLTDMTVSRYSVQYKNIVKYVKQHELKLNNLVEILKSKNVLTESESDYFLSEFKMINEDIDFNHEVTNLTDYLVDTDNRLDDIRNSPTPY